MAFTVQQLQAIDDAIANGRLRVVYNGREVIYRSMDDLKSARSLIRGELIATGQLAETPNTNRGPASLAVFSRD